MHAIQDKQYETLALLYDINSKDNNYGKTEIDSYKTFSLDEKKQGLPKSITLNGCDSNKDEKKVLYFIYSDDFNQIKEIHIDDEKYYVETEANSYYNNLLYFFAINDIKHTCFYMDDYSHFTGAWICHRDENDETLSESFWETPCDD